MFSLLRGFLLTFSPSLFTLNLKSAFLLQRSFDGNLPGRGFGAICCVCVSFAWEIVRDSPMVNIVSQTMNKHNSLSNIIRENAPWSSAAKSMLPWKRKMVHDETLRDVIGGHQAYIHRFMEHRILQLA